MPRPTGRPPKLTPALQKAICDAVSVGVPICTAALMAGVGESTVKEWRERGEGLHVTRPRTAAYAAFATALAQARAQDEVRRIARIDQAAKGGAVIHEKITTYADGRQQVEKQYSPPDWRADAFHLERAYQDRWGRRQQVDLSVSIQAAAAKVAAEFGLSAADVLAEARLLLLEVDHEQQ